MNAAIIIIALVLFAVGTLGIIFIAGIMFAAAMDETVQQYEEPKGEKDNATRIDRSSKKNNRRRTGGSE